MKITSKFYITVPLAEIWEVIFNPYNIGKTIPGCESVELIDDNTYLSLVTIKVANIKARYKLISKIVEQYSPFRIVTYTTWEGIGITSKVSQSTTLQLYASNYDSTEVAIDSELNVTGTIANLTARIMRAKIESIAEEWSQRLKALIEEHCQPIEC
ncbi:CoxG family protein [Desulfosporosinus fructosivorans]